MNKHTSPTATEDDARDKEVRARLNTLVNDAAGRSTSSSAANSEQKSQGNFALSEEEKAILVHTSRVNSKVFVPFISADLQDHHFVFPIPFTDEVSSHSCPKKKN